MAIPNGGNEAEQIVNIAFQGIELALKLTGSGTKNLAQFLYSMNKDEKNLNTRSGEVKKVQQLLKENKPLQTYKIKLDDVKRFKGLAKQYGVLYTIVRDVKSEDGRCTVILKEEEVPMLIEILDELGLKDAKPMSGKDQSEPEIVKKKDIRSKVGLENMSKNTDNSKTMKPSVLDRLKKNQEGLKPSKVRFKKKDITR